MKICHGVKIQSFYRFLRNVNQIKVFYFLDSLNNLTRKTQKSPIFNTTPNCLMLKNLFFYKKNDPPISHQRKNGSEKNSRQQGEHQ